MQVLMRDYTFPSLKRLSSKHQSILHIPAIIPPVRKKQKDWAKDLAFQRILLLFKLAGEEFRTHPERSNRYVQLARRIGMRYRVRMPPEVKTRICRYCHSYLVQGATARTRLQGTHIATTCLVCGKQMRRPY